MNHQNFHHILFMSALVIGISFAGGCTTHVVPVSPSEITITDEGHGVLFGKVHLTRNGQDPSVDLQWPREMKWWVEDEPHGKRFLITHLPINGPFAVKLPAGSYRVTDISFPSARGLWHTVLPTAFTIRSRECTSLGTSEIEMHTGFFTGWIIRNVYNEQALLQDDFESLLETKQCPTTVAPLESPVKNVVRLWFHTRESSRH